MAFPGVTNAVAERPTSGQTLTYAADPREGTVGTEYEREKDQ